MWDGMEGQGSLGEEELRLLPLLEIEDNKPLTSNSMLVFVEHTNAQMFFLYITKT
jgi:hypothetical protein